MEMEIKLCLTMGSLQIGSGARTPSVRTTDSKIERRLNSCRNMEYSPGFPHSNRTLINIFFYFILSPMRGSLHYNLSFSWTIDNEVGKNAIVSLEIHKVDNSGQKVLSRSFLSREEEPKGTTFSHSLKYLYFD